MAESRSLNNHLYTVASSTRLQITVYGIGQGLHMAMTRFGELHDAISGSQGREQHQMILALKVTAIALSLLYIASPCPAIVMVAL
jgi:hypothetical protein